MGRSSSDDSDESSSESSESSEALRRLSARRLRRCRESSSEESAFLFNLGLLDSSSEPLEKLAGVGKQEKDFFFIKEIKTNYSKFILFYHEMNIIILLLFCISKQF